MRKTSTKKRKRKTQRTFTRAVTHIRLIEVKALPIKRHDTWKKQNRLPVAQPAVQLGLWKVTSTDVAQR